MTINTPVSKDIIKSLNVGDNVDITGYIYTARDAAHKKMVEEIKNGQKPPFPFDGQIVYYAGPSPAVPGQVIGSIGPTTSGRMDKYSTVLIQNGLCAMIGKGGRNEEVIQEIIKNIGVYFAAVGGAAALFSKCIKSAEVIAYSELGTEAVRKLYVENFPVIVAVDCNGNAL